MTPKRKAIINYYLRRSKRSARSFDAGDPRLFNEQVIGLPRHPATDKPSPLLAYQLDLDNQRYPFQAVAKSNKVGITEIMLRKIVRKTVAECRSYQQLIITQRFDMALEDMRRLQRLFRESTILREFVDEDHTTYDRLVLTTGSEVIAVPASAKAIRGYPRVKHVFIDEAAHFALIEDNEILSAATSRLANTQGTLDMVSTPRGQRGFFHRIVIASETRTEFPFKAYRLPYHVALGKLIQPEFIEAEKTRLGPLFPQEYEAVFLSSQTAALPEEHSGIYAEDSYLGMHL
jgi:hypothetical protein